MSLVDAARRRVTIRAPRVRLRSPIRSPFQSPVAYQRGNLFGVVRTTLRVTRKTVTGTVFHPIRTAIIVLLVLLLFPAARPELWRGLKAGAGVIVPGSYEACSPLPEGGLAGVAGTVGVALHKLTEPPPSNAAMLAGMESAARSAGHAWSVFRGAVNGVAVPTGLAQPAQQVGLTSCCPATGGGTIPANLTDSQVSVVAAKAAIGAGFPADQLVTAVAVAGAESGWDPGATHVNSNGSTDYGLWQVNSVHADLLASGNWRDPQANARMAYSVWRASGWSAWTTFNSGAWQGYVGAARTAVAKAQGQLGPFLPVSVTTVPVATCTPRSSQPASTSTTAAVAFALAQVGKPYRWGAPPMPTPTGPVPTSYDCSSLVQSALLAGGIGLPGRQTTRTLINVGVEVPASDIQAGDIVFPDSSHVALAIGGGEMVEAPTPGQVVRRGPLYGAWKVRRLTTPIAGGPTV